MRVRFFATAARDALGIALKDSDADVRAYARRALQRKAGLAVQIHASPQVKALRRQNRAGARPLGSHSQKTGDI